MQTEQTGPLIAVEGADGSGKETQVELLKAALTGRGYQFSAYAFPRYKGPYGALIKRGLEGEFGNFLEINPYVLSALWAADRAGVKDELIGDLRRGIVICDRYVTSNLAYQGARFTGKARTEFIRYTEKAEYGYLGLPRPDLVIYLSVPVSISGRLLRRRGDLDQYEASLAYQREVARVYTKLARTRRKWAAVRCAAGGKLRSPEEIHQDVLSLVLPLLNG